MPRRLAIPCNAPRCGELVEGRYCEKHRYLAADDRPSASKRGYDWKWKKLRDKKLQIDPYCEDPEGRHDERVLGRAVDHIIPLPKGPRLEWSNLQTLCRSCHERKTAREKGRKVR